MSVSPSHCAKWSADGIQRLGIGLVLGGCLSILPAPLLTLQVPAGCPIPPHSPGGGVWMGSMAPIVGHLGTEQCGVWWS